MKTFITHWAARAAILCFTVYGTTGVLASPPTAADTAPAEVSADLTRLATPDALRLAYDVLLPGNHNYDWHRGYAMDEIAAAAKSFGLDLTERGKGGEEQKKSDARLKLAQRILETLRPRLVAEEQSAVLDHVDRALKRLDLGLKFREIKKAEEALK